jgi:hypothetical protein
LRKHVQPVPWPDAKKITQWIGDLDNAKFAVREQAMRELEQLQDLVEEPLLRVLAGKPSLETRRRVQLLLANLASRPPASKTLQALRAIAVLEAVGTAEACDILRDLAAGAPGALVTEAARAALARW